MKNGTKCFIVGILCAAAGAAIMGVVKDASYLLLEGETVTENFRRKLTLIDNALAENYIYDIDKKAMTESAIKGYVKGLDEVYTNYYSPEEFEQYTEALEDTYVGIGVVISATEENFIEVISAFEDSSAYEAGIKPGDILYKIEDKEYYGEEMDEAVAVIKGGKEGTKVKLTLIRDGKEIEMEVERRVVSMQSVKSEMMDGNIGYLRISSFNTEGESSEENTYTEYKENIEELKNAGAKKLIIDLRDNPGGALDIVVNIADDILPEGLITYVEYKDGTREEYKSDANALDMPIAVLINGNSASASEVLTGALKDYKKATVIGTTSYGKGVVQSVMPFPDGSGMSMTIAKYYSPNGVCIQDKGIEPDIEVKLDEKYDYYYASELTYDEDLQLQKAVEVLNEK